MTHLLFHKTPNSVSSEPGAAQHEGWIRKLFWTAEEAAALSFGRSPDKIIWDEDFGFRGLRGISEFATNYCMVLDFIVEAQSKEILPLVIPTRMYVRWAEANQVPLPPDLAKSVDVFYDALMETTDLTAMLQSRLEQLNKDLVTFLPKTTAELNPKLRNSMLRVILGVAKDKYLHPKKPGTALRISNALLTQGIDVGEDTIQKYLKEAEELA
jgi:hypothetical protein